MVRIMPLLHRHLLEPFHGWVSRSQKLRYWNELERTQYLPESRLREIQRHRLEALIQFVWENNQFYRKRLEIAGVAPRDIRTPEDLYRLPILTKSEIRAQAKNMISRGFRHDSLQKAKTGGSTGKALEIFFSEECSHIRNACTLRHDLWSGWKRGEPIAAIWGNPVYPSTIGEKIRSYIALPPMIYLDTMSISLDSVHNFVKYWRQTKPTLIFGHAHSIFILAEFLEEMNIKDLCPRGIISSSMMLLPHEREKIENVFRTRVIDRYGCEEVSLIGCECEKHEGMHLNIEHLIIEFLRDDDSPAVSGEPGLIVVTDLINKAMPLIRYQVEDVGVQSDRKCSCGRGLPMMEHVVGRTADFLIKSDGSKIAGVSLIENTLTKIPGIDQMQIVQNELTEIILNVVPSTEYDRESANSLTMYFQNLFGGEVRFHIEILKE